LCALGLTRPRRRKGGRSAAPYSDRGNPTHAFTGALTLVQGGLDSLLKLGGYPRPAKSFALVLGPPKPGPDSLCDHRALKLGEHAHHLKHGLAARRRGVQALLVQEQVDV
jgi:hypothetical protein